MSAPSRRRTVLVVDDEPAIRELMRRFLEEDGYRLLEAPNGAKALALAQEYDAQIDVLVTDVVMPDMDGLTLASKLTSQRSETRVLFVTGHASDDQDVQNALRCTPHHLLLKPFSGDALSRKIEQVLLTRKGVGPTAARFVKAIPVLYLPSGQTDWLRGMTVDISDSGILLEAVSPLAIGSRLDVTLDASEAFGGMPRGTVLRHGQVVRHGTPTASIPHPVGIRFLAAWRFTGQPPDRAGCAGRTRRTLSGCSAWQSARWSHDHDPPGRHHNRPVVRPHVGRDHANRPLPRRLRVSGLSCQAQTKSGDCCVFCSYGGRPCPPMQAVEPSP